ncbi:hypothetical protein RN001_009119 [Aquatica leii]|uniref:DUF7041 domain-containing protein n=1 Tax=Aquatica leii TaxID=1421715 RepID=A0AAN7SMR2_9COLE|nr:hypothetical protein RN001_009119 [Aquatica leii]
MHPSTDIEQLKTEINALEHEVKNVSNIRQRKKIVLPLFHAELKAQPNNKEIYNIKYYCVINNLEAPYASEVVEIIVSPPSADKYIKFKEELIARLSTSQEKKTKQLLEFEELGDRQPSQFLRHLRGLAGNTVPDKFLRTIWSSRLPPYTQAIFATVSDQPLDATAKQADQVSETWPKSCTSGSPS